MVVIYPTLIGADAGQQFISKLKLYWGTGGCLRKLALTSRSARNHTIEKNERFVERQKSSDHMEAINIRMTEQTTADFCASMMSGDDSYCRCVNLHIFLYWVSVWSQNSRPEESSDDSDHLLCKVLFSFPFDVMKSLLLMGISEISVWKKVSHQSARKLDTVSLNVVCSDHKDSVWIILNHRSFTIRHFYHTVNTEACQIFAIKLFIFSESTSKCGSLINCYYKLLSIEKCWFSEIVIQVNFEYFMVMESISVPLNKLLGIFEW